MAGKFQYKLHRDPGVTGNLECAVFSTADAASTLEGDGEVVHSKKATGKFPMADIETCKGLIAAALENL